MLTKLGGLRILLGDPGDAPAQADDVAAIAPLVESVVHELARDVQSKSAGRPDLNGLIEVGWRTGKGIEGLAVVSEFDNQPLVMQLKRDLGLACGRMVVGISVLPEIGQELLEYDGGAKRVVAREVMRDRKRVNKVFQIARRCVLSANYQVGSVRSFGFRLMVVHGYAIVVKAKLLRGIVARRLGFVLLASGLSTG
jgi:hypothetical protein